MKLGFGESEIKKRIIFCRSENKYTQRKARKLHLSIVVHTHFWVIAWCMLRVMGSPGAFGGLPPGSAAGTVDPRKERQLLRVTWLLWEQGWICTLVPVLKALC